MALLALQSKTFDEEAAYVKRTGETSFARPFNADQPNTKRFQGWVSEAQFASRDWRSESWRDCEMFDGNQWTEAMEAEATAAGIEPLTINQIFPTLSLVIGSQTLNKLDIIAKGRTHKDTEISQIMSEGIKFVMDQWDGEFKVSDAFKGSVIPGFGCLAVEYDDDPRNEVIKISNRDWKEIWWDPYASPWMDPRECRYVFHSKWVDLHNLIAMFPEKRKEIEDAFSNSNSLTGSENGTRDDEANLVEWKRRVYGSGGWVDATRKRCRPVEMWYTVNEPAFFLRYPDGNVEELPDNMPVVLQFEKVKASVEVIKAIVKRMRVCTFLGDIVLEESRTPYAHDDFPFIPFVGYLDRYLNPYGVPRQIRDMQIEVNKRRSMALRLLNARRVLMESDAVDEGDRQATYEEANKPDGFLIVRPGALRDQKIVIVEQSNLAPAQMNMMQQSEMEIQRVSGVNASNPAYSSGASEANSSVEKRGTDAVTITAPLFDNLRRSMKRLGEQVVSAIQHKWTGEKVLRITDRMTGAERFVEINKQYEAQYGSYEVKNDVTQGRYDVVISEVPMADTAREQSLQLLIEWAKRSTPEMIAPLMSAALELSNIPNKDKILAQIKPLMGISPEIEDMDANSLKQYQIQQAEAKAQFQQTMQQIQTQTSQAQLDKLLAEIAKVQADTARVVGNVELDPIRQEQISIKTQLEHLKAQNDAARVEIEGFKAGAQAQHQKERLDTEKQNRSMDDEHRVVDREVDFVNQEADRQQLDEHKLLDIQKELALTPPAEKTVARQDKNIGSKAEKKVNL